MKRIFTILSIGLILASCGASDEDYVKAAEELCDCVNKEKAKPENLELVEKGIITDANATAYNFCMDNQMKDKGVDFKDQRMLDALKDKCPDLVEAHKEYMNSAAGKETPKKQEEPQPEAISSSDFDAYAALVAECVNGKSEGEEMTLESKTEAYEACLMGEVPNEKELDLTGDEYLKAIEKAGLLEVHNAMMAKYM